MIIITVNVIVEVIIEAKFGIYITQRLIMLYTLY